MTTNARTARARGAAIEHIAAQWLGQQGLALVTQNHYVKGGELDLVMRDGDILVFVEVKHRKTTRYGHPLETVTYQKQQRLARAARLYIARGGLSSPCRFDILAITGKPPDLEFDWVKAAFDAF
ncbi:YraN family protein [Halomonas sp. ISL-60]|uniref:YraN family protein n=1 Tax=Halomonas sp. ISL-56 TaxID=2819149 RepID=UPI001BE91AC9|nr:YraN family protein [Halomonas sp. ISL-56]MBT2774001.1 YraN family protein [Halomonas sp. ISL-60]MBT2802528.1 YraN family protein [Halomonas sp. ISL-56]